jgi:D-alanyl-D-alanine carboxypeptidase (penicillin-binding protein 5/6)
LKKAVNILLIVAVLLSITSITTLAAPALSAKTAILIDAQSGETLFEQGADTAMQIASTTKIMTALVALENCKLTDVVEIKREYTGIEGSSFYLKVGEKLTVRELLYGLMLASGNDAAVALACHTAGSVAKFAALMNDRATSLGCDNCGFANPHGLDAKGHYASARDLAKITAEAMKNPDFAEIVSTKTASVAGRALQNHNKLLWNYAGTIGVKTGYTISAGRSLVSCAERDGVRLICVTLSDPNDWDDHMAMYDFAFSEYKLFSVRRDDIIAAPLPVVAGAGDRVTVHPNRDYNLLVSKTDTVTTSVQLPKFVYAGVIRGARAGTLFVRKNGELVAEIPLIFSETVRLGENEKLEGWELVKWAWYFSNAHANTTWYSFNVY